MSDNNTRKQEPAKRGLYNEHTYGKNTQPSCNCPPSDFKRGEYRMDPITRRCTHCGYIVPLKW